MSVKEIKMPRFKEKYLKEIRDILNKQFSYANPMMIPKIEKVVVNVGSGQAANDKGIIKNVLSDLERITGQKAVTTTAKKSVAGFKIREGWPVGAKVTLRGARMYEFLDRLVSVALPRVRDFRGINPKSFDGRGNYSLGMKEQVYFLELDYESVDGVRGLDIVVQTSAKTNEEAFALLKAFGFPFYEKRA